MKTKSSGRSLATVVVAAALLLFLVGCTSRSISDSGYRPSRGWARSANPMYAGELTELDILGAAPKSEATQENIARALAAHAAPGLKRGDRVMLIQSGAMVPDHAMIEAASRYFDVAPFTGVPPQTKEGLSASLRLRAAQGGYRYLLCYWGVLESAMEDREGRAVSWVPIAGMFIPDQKQKMRIRLKALLVDVGTGAWRMLTPAAHSDAGLSSRLTRENADQRMVEALKAEGYRRLISDVLTAGPGALAATAASTTAASTTTGGGGL